MDGVLVKQGGTGDFQVDPTGSVALTGGRLTSTAKTTATAPPKRGHDRQHGHLDDPNSTSTSVIFNPAELTNNAGMIVNATGNIQVLVPFRAPAA